MTARADPLVYGNVTAMSDGYESEKMVERYLLDQCDKQGWLCWKWTSPGRAGVPDRIIVGPPGGPVTVELKQTNGRLSIQQVTNFRMLAHHGWPVHIAWSKQDVDDLMTVLLWQP